MHLNIFVLVICCMSRLDTTWTMLVSSYKSMQCTEMYNLYEHPLSCTVQTVTGSAGKVQCYRLCGFWCTSGHNKRCDVFLVNTTTDGTTLCYLCHYNVNGEYLLSQLDGIEAYVTQDLTNKSKSQSLKGWQIRYFLAQLIIEMVTL